MFGSGGKLFHPNFTALFRPPFLHNFKPCTKNLLSMSGGTLLVDNFDQSEGWKFNSCVSSTNHRSPSPKALWDDFSLLAKARDFEQQDVGKVWPMFGFKDGVFKAFSTRQYSSFD